MLQSLLASRPRISGWTEGPSLYQPSPPGTLLPSLVGLADQGPEPTSSQRGGCLGPRPAKLTAAMHALCCSAKDAFSLLEATYPISETNKGTGKDGQKRENIWRITCFLSPAGSGEWLEPHRMPAEKTPDSEWSPD